jgi:hypothetical protein
MVLAGEPLAVLDLHHLPGPRMERIEDPRLKRRTPGIVTLVRLKLAKTGSPRTRPTQSELDPSGSSVVIGCVEPINRG